MRTPEQIVESAIHEVKYGTYGSFETEPHWPASATVRPLTNAGSQLLNEDDVEKLLVKVVEKTLDEVNERIDNLRIT